jgi:hypothetical protein
MFKAQLGPAFKGQPIVPVLTGVLEDIMEALMVGERVQMGSFIGRIDSIASLGNDRIVVRLDRSHDRSNIILIEVAVSRRGIYRKIAA